MLRARLLSDNAPAWSPLLKISNLISVVARARHKRKVLTLSPRQPTTGVSYATARTTSAGCHTEVVAPSHSVMTSTVPPKSMW